MVKKTGKKKKIEQLKNGGSFCPSTMFDEENEEQGNYLNSDEEAELEEENLKTRQLEKKKKKIQKKIEKYQDEDEEEEGEEEEDEDEDQEESEKGEESESESSVEENDDDNNTELNNKIEKKNETLTSKQNNNNNNWEYVTVTHRISASMNEIKNDESKCISALTNGTLFKKAIKNEKSKKTSSSSKVSDKSNGEGDANHILGGITLIKASNNFPVSVGISVIGVDLKDQTHMTENGSEDENGVIHFYKNQSVDYSSNPIVLVTGNERASQSQFLKEYPGWNANNLNDKILALPDSKGNCLVHETHPVLGIFNEMLQQNGQKKLTDSTRAVNGYYPADLNTVEQCKQLIKDNLEQNLKVKNLNALQFKMHRICTKPSSTMHAEKWSDCTEFEGVSESGIKNMMGAQKDLLLTVQYKYKTI